MSTAVPEDVRRVRTADVYKQGAHVATLTRTPEAVEFAYLPAHVAAAGRAVATSLPVSATPVRTLYRQVCFAWLTGNGDLHAKNLSILEGPGEEWRVAPAYDLPATVPYGDRSLALPLAGRVRGLARKHLLAFADAVGLPRPAAVSVLDYLLQRTADLPSRLSAGALPFAQKATADWLAELRVRRRQATA